ncbi:unnamed protein product [Tilletia controversa]|uniref:Protein farnesyltransferase subunit beta n=3 Tax=Tilletia TaxID=13289 RepID=A0A8X7N012_9BASI|nr:hypothetical protein CF336_g742 [Tilletia laevis]KAE8205034.1 hypothetical protein CF328_g716 [Tilletia controversa]KAE8261798.1 hypothetical protein A4X03_0g2959 [Tilletia caries]KAE8208449.1 hypothetical protein CF335_g407 [Tilletia laevis]KAE8255305.1 hypothetical protein A4X06_0g489 [Tilletia controversa]
MSVTKQPLWPTPDDGVLTETSDAQLDVERTIAKLVLPFHHASNNAIASSDHQQQAQEQPALANPWINEQPQSQAQPLSSRRAAPNLNRQAHVAFLAQMLEPLPPSFVGFDSNRTWILYWVTHSYDLLRTTLSPHRRARAIATLLSCQHPQGGFGGGPNQIAHLMTTYPVICALAIVGGPGPAPTAEDVKEGRSVDVGRGGWDAIDRKAMYRWIMSLKQPDGSFLVHHNGEVDVRASYCVSCISLLLGICTPQLASNMKSFIVSCQTYEGGLAASSHLGPTSYMGPPPQLGEAHGGYAHCALASYLSLITLEETYQEIQSSEASATATATAPLSAVPQPELDLDALLHWACTQQGLAIEGGAFRGRTNKLVDGCYGWFGGAGLFTVLDACLNEKRGKRRRRIPQSTLAARKDADTSASAPSSASDAAAKDAGEDGWSTESEDDALFTTSVEDDWLFDPIALQEYILIAAQNNSVPGSGAHLGGLRDKPGKRADAYHTCYNLSGLSLCQHRIVRSREAHVFLERAWKSSPSEGDESSSSSLRTSSVQLPHQQSDDWQKACYVSALAWLSEPPAEGAPSRIVGEPKTNGINPTHPLFNLTFPRVKMMMDWAYQQK